MIGIGFIEEYMKINYPNMVLRKSEGATNSERYLIEKCENTFLSLWSYPNPFTTEKKGKELCDVLAVFQNHIFIFSDKFCVWKGDIDKRIAWNRWYRHAVEAGAKQILGAERYIKSNGEIFLDAKLTQRFPLPIEITSTTRIHRIIVARGAKDACVDFFNGGTGSLVVDTRIEGIHHLYEVDRDGAPVDTDAKPIFTIGLVMGRQNYFHVFDDYTLDHIMDDLDTVSDFIDYLEQKEKLIEAGKDIIAEGEEEILGRHLSTIENEQHCCVTISEFQNHQCFYFADFWQNYLQNPNRYVKQKANAQNESLNVSVKIKELEGKRKNAQMLIGVYDENRQTDLKESETLKEKLFSVFSLDYIFLTYIFLTRDI